VLFVTNRPALGEGRDTTGPQRVRGVCPCRMAGVLAGYHPKPLPVERGMTRSRSVRCLISAAVEEIEVGVENMVRANIAP
jgi:hypothetical protein